MLARSVIVQSYFGDDAPVAGTPNYAAPVAPAQAGAYRAYRPIQTHVIGTSLRWCDGVFYWNGFLGVIAPVTGIAPSFVILNLFQDNEPRSHVILKQVQDDALWGEGVGSTPISGTTQLTPT
jgi:hypothetical protein